MRLAVYTITRGKWPLVRKSFASLRRLSGIQFDHFVADNGSVPEQVEWLRGERDAGRIRHLIDYGENKGQQIAANDLLDVIGSEYEWVLRWDHDAVAHSKRFLKKLVRIGEALIEAGNPCVLSPRITKLEHPPPAVGSEKTLPVKVMQRENGESPFEVVKILGGICRLHPVEVFDDGDEKWRFNQYLPMGFGEAYEMADRVTDCGLSMVRVPTLRVEHSYGDSGQRRLWPSEFGWEREVARKVSYGL